jgi:hypothetical protein
MWPTAWRYTRSSAVSVAVHHVNVLEASLCIKTDLLHIRTHIQVKAKLKKAKTIKNAIRKDKKDKSHPETGLIVVTPNPANVPQGPALAATPLKSTKTRAGGLFGLFGKPVECSAKVHARSMRHYFFLYVRTQLSCIFAHDIWHM